MAAVLLWWWTFLVLDFATAFSQPHRLRRQEPSSTVITTLPEPTICGDLIDSVNTYGPTLFLASEAFGCLASVPFNEAVALRFLNYYNMTMQFHSTTAYLKDPPEGYQQPAVDLFAELENIKRNVSAGVYKNQYSFETDVLRLVHSVHDAHVNLIAGIMSTFAFSSMVDLVSASVDGKAVPEVFLASDVFFHQRDGSPISHVTQINGVDVVEYLTRFAALNSIGMLEPHADWNQLMYSPIQSALNTYSTFTLGATFYEGDALNFTFADGSSWNLTWLALYQKSEFTGPTTTGGDYYNYFVLGLPPASITEVPLPPVFNQTSNDDESPLFDDTYGWSDITAGQFPPADVVQKDLNRAGVVTGYFLENISTVVLSLPHFDESSWETLGFTEAVNETLTGALQRNLTQLIVDVQGNFGGTTLLAFATFRQIFPGIEPFAGSRRRVHDMADALGETMTRNWTEDRGIEFGVKELHAANEWVVTDRLNAATDANFSSWAEYYGPLSDRGDLFSLIEKYDLNNINFDLNAFGNWFPTEYLDENEPQGPGPWRPEDVVILTDGQCSSACVLFVEMMTQQAGVRTIAMGGQPKTGPMQAASGSRGAHPYDHRLLDYDFNYTITVDPTMRSKLPSRTDPGMVIQQATFNLRDQMRSGGDPAGPPIQFQYLAADCRLYYTLDNVLNMTTLWHDVAKAAFHDPSRCVEDSTGYAAAAGSTETPKSPPKSTATVPNLPVVSFSPYPDIISAVSEDGQGDRDWDRLVSCKDDLCINGLTCLHVKVDCLHKKSAYACVRACSPGGYECRNAPSNLYCRPDTLSERSFESTVGHSTKHSGDKMGWQGHCLPTDLNRDLC